MDKTESGAKAYQRNDTEDREKAFRDWHRTLGKQLWTTNIDMVEWREVDGAIKPVAILELTRADMDMNCNDNYFKAVEDRYEGDGLQAQALIAVSVLLGVPAYIIVFRKDLSEFWVKKVTQLGWHHCNKKAIERFLERM